LLAHPAQINPQPPHHAVEVAAKAKTVQLTPTPPMAVVFEAWPGAAPSAGHVSAEIVAYHEPNHPTSKEYAALLETMTQSGSGMLLLAGARPSVGASTVLLNLAVIAAQQKKLRVVVVEATGKQAALAQRLGQTTNMGLEDVLAGTVALEHAISKTAVTSLHILPAGTTRLPLGDAAMAWLGAWLRERYDLILIDGPTLDDATRLSALVPLVHGIYLVLPQGDPSGKSSAQTISRLGGRVCGLIHTHFE
jgi:Mrp family chromosome partitioning ATPase